jgi:hypothetical protein
MADQKFDCAIKKIAPVTHDAERKANGEFMIVIANPPKGFVKTNSNNEGVLYQHPKRMSFLAENADGTPSVSELALIAKHCRISGTWGLHKKGDTFVDREGKTQKYERGTEQEPARHSNDEQISVSDRGIMLIGAIRAQASSLTGDPAPSTVAAPATKEVELPK